MDNRKLEQLKQVYIDIQIPEELDLLVRNSIKHGRKNMKRKNNIKKIKIVSTSVAASVVLLTAGVNSSPVLADTLSKVPVVGGIVQVLTFREYKVDENNYNANIKVPSIQGLENKELENSLNEKYLADNKKLYDEFMSEIDKLKETDGGHFGVSTDYEIKTDNDKIFSIGRYTLVTAASSDTKLKYDTIDKEKQIPITLPSLFKDSTYVDIISDNIKSQMEAQIKSDESKVYWIEGYTEEGLTDSFEKISSEQSFYINDKGKLVISFDKYEVAPGYMGTSEFVIPTEAISEVLVGNEYIK